METINNNETPINILFGKINIFTVEDLNNFISNLTNEQALYCLIECVRFSHRHNIFSLEETELISKSIRLLTLPSEKF
jgi:hypothetical protein